MATYFYGPLSSHSRTESSKTYSPKRNLRVTTSFESSKLGAGLQGYGKYTDNVFKSSLRSDMPSPGTFHRTLQHKGSMQASTTASTMECLSARTPKPIFQLASSVKLSARTEITNAALTELKAKENNVLRLRSNVRHQAPAKPKARQQERILKEINREWPSYRSKTSVYTTPYCGSLPTEPDSFVSELLGGASIDINQQLRNIFRAGVKEVNEENDLSVTIPEEQIEVDYLGVKDKNKPYVSRQKQLKSFNKF